MPLALIPGHCRTSRWRRRLTSFEDRGTAFDEGLDALHPVLAVENTILCLGDVVDRSSFSRLDVLQRSCFGDLDSDGRVLGNGLRQLHRTLNLLSGSDHFLHKADLMGLRGIELVAQEQM